MTQGVLVSVSVSAVVYTRILESDRIGACPYRPFSNTEYKAPWQNGLQEKLAQKMIKCGAQKRDNKHAKIYILCIAKLLLTCSYHCITSFVNNQIIKLCIHAHFWFSE